MMMICMNEQISILIWWWRDRYKWQPSPWSACHADDWQGAASGVQGEGDAAGDAADGDVCGGGVQLRRLTCLRLSDSRPVNSNLCRAVTLLPVVQKSVFLLFFSLFIFNFDSCINHFCSIVFLPIFYLYNN